METRKQFTPLFSQSDLGRSQINNALLYWFQSINSPPHLRDWDLAQVEVEHVFRLLSPAKIRHKKGSLRLPCEDYPWITAVSHSCGSPVEHLELLVVLGRQTCRTWCCVADHTFVSRRHTSTAVVVGLYNVLRGLGVCHIEYIQL